MTRGIIDKLNLPPESFLARYVDFASEVTDAPLEFHLGTGLCALAVCCGSRVQYWGFGGNQSWPNLYVLLIAPSGFYRKSTALNIAERLIRTVDPNMALPAEQSREAFIDKLAAAPDSLYAISEFSNALQQWSRDYAVGFKEAVTDLYDNREQYTRTTKAGGMISIKRPAITILAASTADWLRDSLKEGDMRGGLMGRFLMIPAGDKLPDRGPIPEDATKRASLLQTLSALHTNTRVTPVNVASQLPALQDWVKLTERRLSKHPNPDMIGFHSRIGSHVLKLAVLLCISEFGASPSYQLTTNHLSKAFLLGDWLLDRAAYLAETGLTKNRFEQQVQRFLTMVGANGGVERSEALRSCHVNVRDFEQIVNTCLERKQVMSTTEKPTDGPGRPRTIYRKLLPPVTDTPTEEN